MALTLLHTADVHLGKAFGQLSPERARQRRADLLDTLARLSRRAREERVDLMCVAGDLFDTNRTAGPTLAIARRALAEAQIPVIIAPGNHDPLEDGSPFLDGNWPANVLIASQPGWQRIPFADHEIWAFGYARGEAHLSPWKDFPGCSRDALLIMHAACQASLSADDASYYPFTPDQLPACGYVALGHFHRQGQVAQNPTCWYAGSPEPLEGEVVPAGALRVTIEGASTKVEAVECASRRHRIETIEVTGMTREAVWDRALSLTSPADLLDIKLIGMMEPRASLDIEALRAELSTRSFAAQIDARGLRMLTDPDKAEGVLGALYALGQARLDELAADDPGRERVERAIRYSALALEGDI